MTDSMQGVVASAGELIQYRHHARAIDLKVSPGARSILAGNHVSRFRGRGMDFSESRLYQSGDDIRHMDWRVTARTGEPHTKLYVEERERPVFIAIDFSPSLYFGTRDSFKSVTAARAAALLAWAATRQGDRVGAVFATSEQVHDIKPRGGRRGAMAVINTLTRATALPATNHAPTLLEPTLRHLASVVHPGSLVLLMSDFYQIGPESEKLLARIRTHNDLVAFMLTDPMEMSAPSAGRYAISDGENRLELDTGSRPLRRRYRQLYLDRLQQLADLSRSNDFALVQLVNGEDVRAALHTVFDPGRKRR